MTPDNDTEALIDALKAALAEYDRYDPYISNEKIMKQAYEIIEEARKATITLRAQQDRIADLERTLDASREAYNEAVFREGNEVAKVNELLERVKELDAECQASMKTIADERIRAETAEARVKELERELAGLREEGMRVLEPFALEAIHWIDNVSDDSSVYHMDELTVGDYRAARAFMQKMEKSDANNG